MDLLRRPAHCLDVIAGTSLFVLTGLVHEASHHLLSRRVWLNDLMGNLAGTFLAMRVSAYRRLHLKHHQTTNRDDDPNRILKPRWMILFGVPTYVALTPPVCLATPAQASHSVRYLVELAGIGVLVALIFALPRGRSVSGRCLARSSSWQCCRTCAS